MTDVDEFLEAVTVSVQDTVNMACKFDEMYKTLNELMETLGTSVSELRASAEEFCNQVQNRVSISQSDRKFIQFECALGIIA